MLPLANLATDWVTATVSVLEAAVALSVAVATYKKRLFKVDMFTRRSEK
jgi:hypothetical protein